MSKVHLTRALDHVLNANFLCGKVSYCVVVGSFRFFSVLESFVIVHATCSIKRKSDKVA